MKFIRRLFFAVILFGIFGLWFSAQRPDIPYEELEARYASKDSQFLELRSGDVIHFRDQGSEDKPVIILVHGYSASLHTWEPWVEYLKADFRVVSLDLPGHGLTREVDLESVSIPSFVDVINEVADNLELQTFTLVGSSMGGATAWTFALDYSERLEGLVLVGASGWPREEERDTPIVFRLLESPIVRPLLKNMDITSLFRSGLEASFVDKKLVTDEMVERYFSLSRAPGHRDALYKLSTDESERMIATPELVSGISVPTLVLHGEYDNLVPVEGGHKFVKHLPNARGIIYDGIGHIPQEEIPELSSEDLRDFIESVRNTAQVDS